MTKDIKTPYIEIGKKPKVIIALAVQDTIKTKTALSLIQGLHNAPFEYDVIASLGCDLIGSRTRLVRQAMLMGGTHILFVDHDMFFPATRIDGLLQNPIVRLLSHNKDIVGVAYNFRSLPPRSTATPFDAKPVNGKYEVDPATLPKELFKCVALGTGFLLIKLSIFDKIAKPWFQFGRDENAELVYGEDTWLCQQALKAGFEIWCDPSTKVYHVGEFNY